MSAVWPYLAAILPTILVAILFYFLVKSFSRATAGSAWRKAGRRRSRTSGRRMPAARHG